MASPSSQPAKSKTETAVPLLTKECVLQLLKGCKKTGFLPVYLEIPSKNLKAVDTAAEGLRQAIYQWFSIEQQPLWRRLTWALDGVGESVIADRIKNYSEPPLDPTLTEENISTVMKLVGDWREVGECLIGRIRVDMIEKLYSSDTKRALAAGHHWVATSYTASWQSLADALYKFKEFKAVEAVKQFLPEKDPSLTTENVIEALSGLEEEWDPGMWKDLGQVLGIPETKLNEIERGHRRDIERLKAVLAYWIKNHPWPSWDFLLKLLDPIEEAVREKHIRVPRSMRAKKLLREIVECGFVRTTDRPAFLALSCLADKRRVCNLCQMLRKELPNEQGSTLCASKDCVLPCTLPTREEMRLKSQPPSVPPLLIYFPDGGPRLGVFCLLIAYLMVKAEWKLLPRDDGLAEVAHDSVAFALPDDYPGRITVMDSFSSFIKVSMNSKVGDVPPKICPQIRTTVLEGIEHVAGILRCTNLVYKDAFMCSGGGKDCTRDDHPAIVVSSSWSDKKAKTCTINQDVGSEVTEKELIWFPKAAVTSTVANEFPNMMELTCFQGKKQKINVAEEIGIQFNVVGTALLNDGSGAIMPAIIKKCRGDPQEINMEILRQWVQGRGLEDRSWQGLISVLRDSNLHALADNIEEVKGQ